MGIKIKVSEISSLIIYYILIINTCCDINLMNCDIHEMRQKHIDGSTAPTDSNSISANRIEFKINASELEEHIMSGLNMTKKPDIEMVSKRNIKIYQKTLLKEMFFIHASTYPNNFNVLVVVFLVGTNLSSTLNVVDVRAAI